LSKLKTNLAAMNDLQLDITTIKKKDKSFKRKSNASKNVLV